MTSSPIQPEEVAGLVSVLRRAIHLIASPEVQRSRNLAQLEEGDRDSVALDRIINRFPALVEARGALVTLAKLARPQHRNGGFFNPLVAWEAEALADRTLDALGSASPLAGEPDTENPK